MIGQFGLELPDRVFPDFYCVVFSGHKKVYQSGHPSALRAREPFGSFDLESGSHKIIRRDTARGYNFRNQIFRARLADNSDRL